MKADPLTVFWDVPLIPDSTTPTDHGARPAITGAMLPAGSEMEWQGPALAEVSATIVHRDEDLELLRTLTRTCDDADRLEDALTICLAAFGALIGWPVGHAYRPTENNPHALVSTGIWHVAGPEPKRYSDFRTLTEAMRLECGDDLLGRVLRGRQALTVSLVDDDTAPWRKQAALDAGLRRALAFPVIAGNEVAAIVEFFTGEDRAPEDRLIAWMMHLGTQLGRVVERQRARDRIAEMSDQALKASRAKGEFLANMSHEIRTPMNALLGVFDLLADTGLNREQEEYVRIARTAGENLLNLINDILDLSKIEAGRLELEEAPFDLEDVVDQVIEVAALRAHEKHLEISCEVLPGVPARLVGDSHRLRQILLNLVGNAVKFTARGEVVLKVEPHPDAGILLFSVSDTGPGVPLAMQETIFTSFTQADASTTRIHGGTGLGLAISRRLVELMGGVIWIQSLPGEGATFCFTARIGEQQDQANPPDHLQPELTGVTALVVDNAATNRRVLRTMLESSGIIVNEAATADEALTLMAAAKRAQTPFQVTLLNVGILDMDGLGVVEVARAAGKGAGSLILTHCSAARAAAATNAPVAGVDAYVMKPIKRRDLISIVRSVLETKAANRVEAPLNLFDSTSLDTPANDVHQSIPSPGAALRILLAEDSEDNRTLVLKYLSKTPYRVDIAEDGQQALEKFTSGVYDVVLMDMQMPVMDGYTATRAIRHWERARGRRAAPVLALTAHALRDDMEKSLDAGCDAHLTKPIKKDTLLNAILDYAATNQTIRRAPAGQTVSLAAPRIELETPLLGEGAIGSAVT